MKKVLFVTIYPSPYRVDFFNELGKQKDIDLSVVFLESAEEQNHRSSNWFNKAYDNFLAIFLKKRIYIHNKMFICPEIMSILKKDYDEIIFGGYSYLTMMLGMEYLRMKGRRFSIEIDGGLISKDSLVKSMLKKHFISAASKWYSSGSFSDKYLIHYGANPKAIVHYPFSSLRDKDIDIEVDKVRYSERKKAIKEKLCLNEEKIILGIGQFIYRKGFDILLEAVSMLPSDIGIYIVGGMPTEEYLDFVRIHEITNVHFLGFKNKSELQELYLSSDVFVLPTREDIWGLVVNEALANGIPVVTTDRCVAGIELIENGKNGYIVPTENASALADAILKVLAKDSYTLRQEALNKVKYYTIENMVRAHINSICGE